MTTRNESRSISGATSTMIAAIACLGLAYASSVDSAQRKVSAQSTAASDWTRFGWDAGRSNAFTGSTGITAAGVQSLRHQSVTIDGTVDASPIYLHDVRVNGATHDVFFVTTTYGKTLAIDAENGSVLWRYTPSGYDQWAGSYRITTSTPVADPTREYIYAASPDGHVQKLAIADGHTVWSTAITKLPEREKIAAPLNFFRGAVIATTGGYIGDAPPYQGHVAVIDAATSNVLHVWNALCSDRPGLIDPASCRESGAAIWGRAAPVIDSTTGNILVTTGDGHWNGRTDWGDAVLELNPDATSIVGNYTPSNTESLDASDADLGSTAPVLLGPGLIAQGGKDGTLKLLNRSAMRGTAPHRGDEIQVVAHPSGVVARFTAPAVLHTDGETWMFTADRGGTAGWTLSGGRLDLRWNNGHSGTSPVIAGGLLYVYDPGGGLRIYQPTSGQDVSVLECGDGHWNSPIIVDGRIALPEGSANEHRTSGVLNIWRLPSSP